MLVIEIEFNYQESKLHNQRSSPR